MTWTLYCRRYDKNTGVVELVENRRMIGERSWFGSYYEFELRVYGGGVGVTIDRVYVYNLFSPFVLVLV